MGRIKFVILMVFVFTLETSVNADISGWKVTQLTTNDYPDLYPQISGSNIAWQGKNGDDYEIFLYDGKEIKQITNNIYDDTDFMVDGSTIVGWGINPDVNTEGWIAKLAHPLLTLLSPNGGENLIAGSSCPIKWSSDGIIGNVKIEYSINNGLDWIEIVTNLSNTGIYNWLVPQLVSEKCLIRISEVSNPSIFDTSDDLFSIIDSADILNDLKYSIVEIGVPPGMNRGGAGCINNSNQVVGTCFSDDGMEQAFLWQNGSITPLGFLPGKSKSYVYGLSDQGHIIGQAYNTKNTDQHAVLFDPSGSRNNIDLGTLGGPQSNAHGVNIHGNIIGLAKKSDHASWFATRFDPTGNQNNLAIGPPGSNAYAINNVNEVVGGALLSSNWHAMIFDITGGSNNIDLGTLMIGGKSAARSINDLGQIVGEAELSSGKIYATLFDPTGNGINMSLGSLGGDFGYSGDISYVGDINNKGQIVGCAITASGEKHATLFDITGIGNNIDLNTVIDSAAGWTLTYASSINDHGYIVGTGINPDGYERGFLLIPEHITSSCCGKNFG